MCPATACLALALLTSPPDTPELPVEAAEWPTLQKELVALARKLEILDERETRYVLAKREDFETDLNLLRRRYQDLAEAPRLADAGRFPDKAEVQELLSFNRAYRRHLDARQPLEPDRAWDYRQALKETDLLYQVWDAVRDARCEYYYVTVRRQALKRLKNLVGETAYYRAELPPHVPVWRFQEVR